MGVCEQDTVQITCVKDCFVLQGGVMEALLYPHGGKLKLTNSQLQRHKEETSEVLASIDGHVLFQASESHTVWLSALGSKESITQTKPNTQRHLRTRASPHTHTATNTVARPAEAGLDVHMRE